jgi:hypothetical protein
MCGKQVMRLGAWPIADNPDFAIKLNGPKLVLHGLQDLRRTSATRTRSDEGECNRAIPLLPGDRHRVAHRVADRAFGGSPEHVDAGDVDDAPERQPPRAGLDRTAQRNRPLAAELSERLQAATPFDGPRHALRQEEPPRDDVAIPRVDDDLDVLVEQVTVNNSRFRQGSCLRTSLESTGRARAFNRTVVTSDEPS